MYVSERSSLLVPDIMNHKDTHDSVRGLLVHDLKGREQVETTISSSELGVVNNTLGSSGRSNVGTKERKKIGEEY